MYLQRTSDKQASTYLTRERASFKELGKQGFFYLFESITYNFHPMMTITTSSESMKHLGKQNSRYLTDFPAMHV